MIWLLMLVFNGHILIDGYRIDGLAAFESQSSRANLTQTAGFSLPGLMAYKDKKFRVGSYVEVHAGYDSDIHREFAGYISAVKPNYPLAIECEDAMWKMKRSERITETWSYILLTELVSFLDPNADLTHVPKLVLENFRLDGVTKAQVLVKLKEEFLVDAYYRNGRLVVTLPYLDQVGTDVLYEYGRNIISSDFIYKNSEDRLYSVTAVSYLSNGTKLEVKDLGDAGGEQRTLSFYGVDDVAEIKKLANQEIKRLKYSGLEGSFETFGQPIIQFGQVANITDPRYKVRGGRYLTEEVRVSISKSGGFRRNITLGIKVA